MRKKYVMYVDVRSCRPSEINNYMAEFKEKCAEFFGEGRALFVPVHAMSSVQTLEFDIYDLLA